MSNSFLQTTSMSLVESFKSQLQQYGSAYEHDLNPPIKNLAELLEEFIDLLSSLSYHSSMPYISALSSISSIEG